MPKQRRSEREAEAALGRESGSPEKPERKAQAGIESKGEPEEAAAEIEAGGRRKEIADEAIRGTACVEVARPKPPFHEAWRKSKAVSIERSGLFCFFAGFSN